MKDKTVEQGKVLEISIDKIKFKKVQLPKGPTYEVLKRDVVKIKYSNGYTEVFDTTSVFKNASFSRNKGSDTCNYSKIFIVFEGLGDDKFPCYFNDRYIWTLKPNTRLEYKLFSEGKLKVYRYSERSYVRIGPSQQITVQHGQFYGFIIKIPHPQGLDPNKRYSLELISDYNEFDRFLKNDYYGFEPFKECEFIGEEDPKKPVIQ
jgi:hypothetical protein